MKKLDLKKQYKDIYSASAKVVKLVTVPKLNYLMIDGYGDPNSAQFQQAVETLFSVSYNIKFIVKKGDKQVDYGVMPLEGLWWTEDEHNFSMEDKSKWKWTVMVMQPDLVDLLLIEQGKNQAVKKKELPLINNLRFESVNEGLCAQVLHIGPYSTESQTIMRLHQYINENGYKFNGKHREIYLNDMRRTGPEKLQTIIRQPIVK